MKHTPIVDLLLTEDDFDTSVYEAMDFKKAPHKHYTLFDLSSHQRAKEALEFGLKIRPHGYHVFVVDADPSGRMIAPLSFLKEAIEKLTPPHDWVYLNNFQKSYRPLPFKLPAGLGCRLRKSLKEHLNNVHLLLRKAFASDDYLKQIERIGKQLDHQINENFHKIVEFAESHGFAIHQTTEGFQIEELAPPKNDPTNTTDKREESRESVVEEIHDQLNKFTLATGLASRQVIKQVKKIQEHLARTVLRPLWQRFRTDYDLYLEHWFNDMEEDVIEHLKEFIEEEDGIEKNPFFERYMVNLLVDNQKSKHPRLVIESNLTYENIFGSIKYRTTPNSTYETSFTMIRAGALHKANGGILVLRAEDLVKNPIVWEDLKTTLRDKNLIIQEHHRDNTMPLVDAPQPQPIPLDVQVFVVGHPYWYYSFFFHDPEFRSYFKIKAEIDTDIELTPENLAIYGKLISQICQVEHHKKITHAATAYLAQCSSRWSMNRNKISARFEIISNVLAEASVFAKDESALSIEKKHLELALQKRRYRNGNMQDLHLDDIIKNRILIDTEGEVIGQVNGLSVLSHGDFAFGTPARITARTHIGKHGVINIERLTDMSGPIQQKGIFILDGFINSLFAQEFPVSFNCYLTFEQNYSDVEGDSASMAELCAILSSLADVPIRQNIAVTGSVNQLGQAQAVGGIHHKVEGFYDVCKKRGFNGEHGVIIPRINKDNLTLRDDVAESIRKKEFSIWTIDHISQALEILTGIASSYNITPEGIAKKGVFDLAHKKLIKYNSLLYPQKK